MLNRLLSYIGLMRIRTARNITSRLHVYYVKCVNDGVQKDFGIKPALDAIPKASIWWMDEFDNMVKTGENDLVISTPTIFRD